MRSSIRSLPESARALGLAAVLIAGLSWAAPAGGDEALARARYAEGNVAYNVGAFDRALAAYADAYEAKPLPGFLFNMAQCHRQLGHDERAAFFYRRYLDLAPDEPTSALARELLAEVEQRSAARQQRKVAAAPAPFVPVKAAPRPAARAVEEKPGIHRRWWFWTGVGVVTAAAVGGTVYALRPEPLSPTTLGTVDVR